MKHLNIKTFIWAILLVSAIILAIILFFTGTKLEGTLAGTWNILKHFPTVVFIDLFLWFLFVNWGWKYDALQGWLVTFPNLEGTWHGTINPSKEGQSGVTTPIEIFLIIKQSFTAISCRLLTKEAESQSYAGEFIITPEQNSKKLTYSYHSTPKATVRHRSAPHNGTAILNIITSPHRMLRGECWTSRKTTGEMELTYWGTDLLQVFPNEPEAQSV